jgi:hypothetical protein
MSLSLSCGPRSLKHVSGFQEHIQLIVGRCSTNTHPRPFDRVVDFLDFVEAWLSSNGANLVLFGNFVRALIAALV